jgi:FlaA1/EpsC-like NDP-sugar epimerase
VQLIIQAGAMGEGGEVFVLDMGKPVKIMDLAERMIELSGKPEVQIEVVGIRPGEKLHEELFAGDEKLDRTAHPKIWRSQSGIIPDPDDLLEELLDLERTVEAEDSDAALQQLRRVMKPRIEAGAKSL